MPEIVYPKFRWFVFVALVLATAGSGVALIWPAPLMEQVAKHINMPLGITTGAVMVSFSVFTSIGAIIGGICCDRFGITPTLIISCVLMVLGMLLTPVLGHTLLGLLATRILSGLGAGPVTMAVGSVAATWFPAPQRGPVSGVAAMCVSLGVFFGFASVPATYLATQNVAVTAAWLSLFPAVGLLAFLLVAFGPKPPIITPTHQALGESSTDEFTRAARLPVFVFGILTIFCMSWSFSAINDLTPVYLSAKAPLGAGHGILMAGRYMGLMQVSMMLGAALSGFMIARLFKGNVRRICMLAFTAMAICVFSLKTAAVTSNLGALPAFLIGFGFCQGLIVPSCVTFVSTVFPNHIVGKIVGIWLGIGMIGGTVGVIVGAALLNHTGLYQASLSTVGMIGLAGLLFSNFLRAPEFDQKRTDIPATEKP